MLKNSLAVNKGVALLQNEQHEKIFQNQRGWPRNGCDGIS